MAEYIERENAYKLISEQKEKAIGMYSKGRNDGLDIAKSIIHSKEQCPTADVVEVKHGEWFLLDECANEGVYCSVCRKKVYRTEYANQKIKSKFCPNCGAKMTERVMPNER